MNLIDFMGDIPLRRRSPYSELTGMKGRGRRLETSLERVKVLQMSALSNVRHFLLALIIDIYPTLWI